MRQHIIGEVNGREFAGKGVTDEAIWQRDTVQSFNKQESDSLFPFFERLPWLARGRQGSRRKVFPSLCNAESFDGGLDWGSSREDGPESTDLRDWGG